MLVFPNVNMKLIFDENDTLMLFIYVYLYRRRLFLDNNTSIKKKNYIERLGI